MSNLISASVPDVEFEHPVEEGEMRSFEKCMTNEDTGQTVGRGLLHMMRMVKNFELEENKRITRAYITVKEDSVLLEVFYKDK